MPSESWGTKEIQAMRTQLFPAHRRSDQGFIFIPCGGRSVRPEKICVCPNSWNHGYCLLW